MRHFSRSAFFDGARPWVKTLESLRTYLRGNIGSTNAFSLPVMSAPPTIRTQTHPLSGVDVNLTVAHLYSAGSTVFQYEGGGDKAFAGTNFRRFPTETFATTGGNLSDGENASSWQVRFVADAAKVSFRLLGSTLRYRFIVDGQYVSRTGTLTSVNTGTEYITLDFGTKAARTIVVESEQGTAFGGVYVAPGDTATRPAASPYRMMVLGDSITVSTGATVFGDGFVPVTAGYLGISDRWLNGPGGTGYVSKGAGSAFFSLPERISQDMTRFKAFGSTDIIVVAAGINDVGLAGVQAAANSVFNSIRTLAPNALVFVVGPWDSAAPSAPSANYLATKAAIQAAASGRGGFWFLDPQGRAYSKMDSVHPNTNGHLILGQWLASQIRDAIASAVLWYDAPSYADLSAIADFSNNQYALPAFGPETVTNGTFDSGLTGWTINNGATLSVVSGELQISSAASFGGARQVLNLKRGSTYEVVGTARNGTSNGSWILVGNSVGANDVLTFVFNSVANATQRTYFTAQADTQYLTLQLSAAGAGFFDNVSVREVILTRNAVALGANKFTDPGFTTVTGWSAAYQSTVAAVGGRMRVTAAGGTNPYASYQFTDLEIGSRYRFMWTGFAGTAAIPELILGNTAPLASQEYGAGSGAISGFQQLEFTATSVNLYIKFRLGSTAIGNYFEVDDVSLQKLPATGAYPKRGATFAEWLAFTAASDTARSYVDQSGTWRNSSDGFTNLVRNNSTTGSNSVIFSAGTKTAIVGESGDPGIRCVSTTETTARFPLATVSAGTRYSVAGRIRLDPTWTGTVTIDIGDGTGVDITSQLAAGAERDFSAIVTAGSSGNFVDFFSSGFSGKTQDFVAIQLAPGLVASRPIVTSGDAVFGGVNAPRLDFRNSKRQLRLEDARTNAIRNNSMVGAVVGTIGSGGGAPTGWAWDTVGLPSGITRSITGFGTENGLPYVDVNIAGTAGANGYEALTFTAGALTSMSPGQTWTGSLFAKLIAGVIPAGTSLYFRYENASNGQLQDAIASLSSVNSTMQRLVATNATAPANTAQGRMFLLWSFATGVSYNLTLRLYGPQLEQASFASDLMLTAGAAVTRAIETARFSPLLEAVMQRAAASVVVRGRLDAVPVGAAPRVVGGNGGVSIIGGAGSGTIVGSYNGTTSISATVPSSGNIVSPFGTVAAFDSSGRTVGVNGALSGGDTATIGDRAQVLLARAVYIGGSSEYSHGLYDFVGISPERLPSATLLALAVPA